MSLRHENLLDPEKTALIVVDLQEAFRPVIHEFDKIAARSAVMVRAAEMLNVPVLVTEQSPGKLGATVPEIKSVLPAESAAVVKTAFSCCGSSYLNEQLRNRKVNQVMLCGIEAHICMSQSVHDLLALGYQVHVLEDCVSSRTPANHEVGLAKMRRSGALPSSSEMALFEMMRDARHEHFRAISKMIK